MTPEPCTGEVCITCSDQAVPVTVIELGEDDTARVDTGAGVEEVSVALVDAAVGDVVLVHAGEAIATIGTEDPPSRADTRRSSVALSACSPAAARRR